MLAGKTIVVTGAASGIGAQTCKELQMQGAAVIGVDRNKCDNVVDRMLVVCNHNVTKQQ